MEYSPLYSAIIRFVRVVVAGGVAGAMTVAIGQVANIPDPEVAVLLGAVLVAVDKYARANGWYR